MRYDHFTMLPEKAFQPRNGRRGMTLETGGGGGGGTSTTYTSNIPEWLRPQTEALLGAATQEYFNTQFNPETGKYDITGIKGYKPFSEDKSAYFAPFTQQQRDVFGEVGGMTTSPLYGQAAGMTRQAGMGGMGTAQQALGYGQLGSGYGGLAAGMAPQAQLYGQTAADIGSMGLRAEELGRDVGAEARQYARQAAGMGGTYEQIATDPMSVQGYMSPYMQQVVERQKLAAIEDAQRANLGQNLAASRQGTYGGARQALAQSQREAALEKQLGDIQAAGLQSAFEQAQKAQQFGVTTGLQGLQGAQAGLGTALQGGQLGLSGIGQAMAGQQAGLAGLGQAGQLYGQGMQGAGMGLQGVQGAQAGYGLSGQMGAQLSNLATAQQQADIQRLGLQREIGGEQQAREQGMINQAIQDYAMAQQYPFQQLAGYSGLLRGYATPTTTVSQYQAAQSPITQFAGAGTSLAGLGQIVGAGKKEGGQIKSYAQGGITSVDSLEGMAEDLSIPQLQQSIQNKTLPEYVGIPILQNKVNNAERMQMAQAGIAPDMGQEPSIANKVMARADALQGIDAVPVGVAGGGMVAFDKGGIARFQNQGVVQYDPNTPFNRMFPDPRRRVPMTEEEKEEARRLKEASMLDVLGLSKIPAMFSSQIRPDMRLKQNQAAYDDISDVPFNEKFNAPPAKAPGQGIAPDMASQGNKAASARQNAPGAAPAGVAPAQPELSRAELFKQRLKEQQELLGEDPRIKAMEKALAKQGEEGFLDRALRGLQMIGAGEKIRTKGDFSELDKVTQRELERRKGIAEREMKKAELAGAKYQREADVYKEVAGEEREKAKTKEERAFQEKLVRLQASLKPEDFNNRLLSMAMGKSGSKSDQELARKLLEGRSKSTAITYEDAAKIVDKRISDNFTLISDIQKREQAAGRPVPDADTIRRRLINQEMAAGGGRASDSNYDYSAADALVGMK